MTKHWLKVIGILEIIGGASGLLYVAWVAESGGISGASVLVALVVIGIYALSVIAGIGLLLGKAFGRPTSIIVQAIQLCKLISPPLIFLFSFGLDFYVYFVGAEGRWNLGFQFNFLSFFQLYINNQGAPFGLGVSVTAVLSLIALIKAKRQNKEEEIVPLPPPPPPSWE